MCHFLNQNVYTQSPTHLLVANAEALTSGGIYFLDCEAQRGNDMAEFQAVGFSFQENVCLLRLIVRHAVDRQHKALSQTLLENRDA